MTNPGYVEDNWEPLLHVEERLEENAFNNAIKRERTGFGLVSACAS
jgi:hypothetical protein